MEPPYPSEDPTVTLTPSIERALVENHRRFLAFLEHRLESRAVAEELLQDALMRTLESGTAPQDDEGAVAWFYRVLRNALVDHHRKQSAEGRALERLTRESTEVAEDGALHEAVCTCMRGLLPALKPEYAEIVERVDLEQQPVSDVARLLGVTANNAGVRLHRARQALKRQLERACGSCATHGCLDCTCDKQKVADPL
jgi:RNA polymerase sigma-70 factor (ECF subfamily)